MSFRHRGISNVQRGSCRSSLIVIRMIIERKETVQVQKGAHQTSSALESKIISLARYRYRSLNHPKGLTKQREICLRQLKAKVTTKLIIVKFIVIMSVGKIRLLPLSYSQLQISMWQRTRRQRQEARIGLVTYTKMGQYFQSFAYYYLKLVAS